MKEYKAVILAAGRGSRMCSLTSDKPKCMLQLLNKPLLFWQLESLEKANIHDIYVVRGYKAELLNGKYKTVDNIRWAETNMVASLQCVLPEVQNSTVIISYADIVYHSRHVEKLLLAEGDICITYDTLWQELWAYRAENTTNDILADAETFKQQNGVLFEIGKKTTSLEEVQGQYMGLLKFTPRGFGILNEIFNEVGQEKVDKLDMTSLLSLILEKGIKITAVPVEGAWCESDTQKDIEKYEQALKLSAWSHDWRK